MRRAAALVVLLSAAAWPTLAADLSIRIEGLGSAAGAVHYGVYAEARHFPKPEGRVAKGHVAAHPAGVTVVVKGLPPGTYAVAVFHDENGNGEFDQGFLGFPLEDYGFSNDATVFFGPPSFSEAAFELPAGGGQIVIRLDD